MIKKLLLITFISLVGCQSIPIVRPEIVSNMNTATILIYREPAFNSAAGSLYFGEGEKTYASLSNGEYTEIQISAGQHNFNVTARASQPFQFNADLKPNTKNCIKAYADPANIAKTLIPILFNLTNIFKADLVSCPNEQFLKDYFKVSM